jgi:hypothetical protein
VSRSEDYVTSKERVIAACEFRTPDRIPRYDAFWEFPDEWRTRFPSVSELSDILIRVPDETILPTHAHPVSDDGETEFFVDDWGRLLRTRHGAYFNETLSVAIPQGTDPDSIEFDAPGLDMRYTRGQNDPVEVATRDAAEAAEYCIFVKTGGPFLRTTYVRGETQFLEDIATDPTLAKVIADRVADHIAAVGVQALNRWELHDTGIWIFDDMAYNDGPLFSPASFEGILLPAYKRMIHAYRDAGARFVFLHSDGDVRPILDMLVDAGIDGLHPIERRAGMGPWELRERYPNLILAGAMDNTDLLVNGPVELIRDETRRLTEFGRNGGYIIGSHSISPEVPLEHFVAYDEVCREEGVYGK